ncbi:hypothetical protein CCACVL1_15259 [Corchorus capsularis]|uniref:Uncharacterized protein n=1 Tax=Corchorus capsularis TaxID=210143 RepID=A0A1R3I301_COCAP|nr:hypothetical protein CCACVL1_15259 [Corchorus capsularis]
MGELSASLSNHKAQHNNPNHLHLDLAFLCHLSCLFPTRHEKATSLASYVAIHRWQPHGVLRFDPFLFVTALALG